MSHVVGVCGLGYVGLPLAVEFGKKFETIGFDLSETKIANYKKFIDPTGEVSTEDLRAATKLAVSTDPASLAKADFIIIAVPTPVDRGPYSRFLAAGWCLDHRWAAHEEGCDGRVRIDGLSRRDRRGLHPAAGKAFRHEVDAGFPRRLLARAGESGRQGTDHHQDRQGGFRRRCRHAGCRGGTVWLGDHRRCPSRQLHQGGARRQR